MCVCAVCVGLRRPEELQKMQPSFKLNESAIEFGEKKKRSCATQPRSRSLRLGPWEMRSRDKRAATWMTGSNDEGDEQRRVRREEIAFCGISTPTSVSLFSNHNCLKSLSPLRLT